MWAGVRRGKCRLLSLREEEKPYPTPQARWRRADWGEGQAGCHEGKNNFTHSSEGNCDFLQLHLQGRAVFPGSVYVPLRCNSNLIYKPSSPAGIEALTTLSTFDPHQSPVSRQSAPILQMLAKRPQFTGPRSHSWHMGSRNANSGPVAFYLFYFYDLSLQPWHVT